MKFSVRIFSSLFISLLGFTLSSNTFAINTDTPERWFEIEVILFNQLGDKATLKEKFPNNTSSTNLPQYKNYFDLLTAHIQPNLSNIKQFIPLCTDTEEQHNVHALLPKINLPVSDSIKAIEQLNTFNLPELTTQLSTELLTKYKVAIPNTYKQIEVSHHNLFSLEQQKKLILDQQKELASSLLSTQNICVISRKDIEKLSTDAQLVNIPLDAFSVETLPTKLNASGAHISNNPYLIANESLLLSDIKQNLQWSKEFKPILHFGWRQVGVTRNKAIPLKLFAGKHFNEQYQQELKNYQSVIDQVNKEKQTEQFALASLNTSERQDIALNIVSPKQNIDAEITQQKLSKIFENIDSIDSININSLLDDIEKETIEDLLVTNEITQGESELFNVNKKPVEPLQPWYLDGFFKLHLDHYLYITADFNIISQSLDKNATLNTAKTSNTKLINFSQNKRAITGEIHYFDHPYVGMIVQIRRFDPSKPKEEAVTQVIN